MGMGSPAFAAKTQINPCQKDLKFSMWIEGLKADAYARGVSASAFKSARPYLIFDEKIVKRDQQQGVFQQTFLQFSERMASAARMKMALKHIRTTYKELFESIERDYGVPAAPIAALWALESDFGAFTGKYSTLSAMTTLAYDCRRADFFRNHLIHALLLLTRGDLGPEEMIGNWAGELGSAQFMAQDYLESGVDYDRDSRVDLVKSIPDTLASMANYFVKHGWRRDEPWIQEVLVPEQLPWEEADPEIQHSISQWKKWGVKPASGPWPKTDYTASLLLPMGRLGPAFLAYPNMSIFRKWNSALVYSTTAAFFAARIAGAPAMRRGSSEIKPLTSEQIIELQNLLLKKGFEIGEADGKIGPATRAAVKAVQVKTGLAADSYPTEELIEKIKLDAY